MENIASDKGVVFLALYNSEDTYDESKGFIDSITVPAAKGFIEAVFSDLAPGQYVVTVFHDLNDSKDLDTGFMGRPKGPFGFSRGAVGKFGPPAFNDTFITIDGEDFQDTVTLQDWSNWRAVKTSKIQFFQTTHCEREK